MKVGIIGYGLMGKRRHKVLPSDCDVMVADVGDSIRQACDADATIISVPTPDLHSVTLDALAKGARRILLEKPCATTSAEAREILERAEEVGAVVVPAYTLRHYPGLAAVHYECSHINTSRYGRLLWLSSQYGHGGGATGWRARQPGGGELLDQGSHLLDLAQWFDPCTGVDSHLLDLAQWFDPCTGVDAAATAHINTVEVEDHVSITYGIHSLLASWVMWRPTFRLALYFEGGSCTITGLGGPYGEHCVEWREKAGRVDEIRNYFDARDVALRWEWRAFLMSQSNARFQDAVRVLELIEEARRCAS